MTAEKERVLTERVEQGNLVVHKQPTVACGSRIGSDRLLSVCSINRRRRSKYSASTRALRSELMTSALCKFVMHKQRE